MTLEDKISEIFRDAPKSEGDNLQLETVKDSLIHNLKTEETDVLIDMINDLKLIFPRDYVYLLHSALCSIGANLKNYPNRLNLTKTLKPILSFYEQDETRKILSSLENFSMSGTDLARILILDDSQAKKLVTRLASRNLSDETIERYLALEVESLVKSEGFNIDPLLEQYDQSAFLLRNIMDHVKGLWKNLPYEVKRPNSLIRFDSDEEHLFRQSLVELTSQLNPEDNLGRRYEYFIESMRSQNADYLIKEIESYLSSKDRFLPDKLSGILDRLEQVIEDPIAAYYMLHNRGMIDYPDIAKRLSKIERKIGLDFGKNEGPPNLRFSSLSFHERISRRFDILYNTLDNLDILTDKFDSRICEFVIREIDSGSGKFDLVEEGGEFYVVLDMTMNESDKLTDSFYSKISEFVIQKLKSDPSKLNIVESYGESYVGINIPASMIDGIGGDSDEEKSNNNIRYISRDGIIFSSQDFKNRVFEKYTVGNNNSYQAVRDWLCSPESPRRVMNDSILEKIIDSEVLERINSLLGIDYETILDNISSLLEDDSLFSYWLDIIDMSLVYLHEDEDFFETIILTNKFYDDRRDVFKGLLEYQSTLPRNKRNSLTEVGECADIDVDGYKVIKKIALGGWSNVYLVEKIGTKTSSKRALKIPFKNIDSDGAERIISELGGENLVLERMINDENEVNMAIESLGRRQISRNFSYVPLPSFKDSVKVKIGEEEKIGLLYEYINGGTIEDVIKTRNNSEGEKINIAAKAAYSLRYVHELFGTHNDIKSDNFMVTFNEDNSLFSYGQVLVLDLALSRSGIYEGSMRGKRSYTAPELLDGGVKPTKKSDQYSFGVMLYELFTGKKPLDYEETGGDKEKFCKLVHLGEIKAEENCDSLPEKVRKIIKKCIAFNPEDRYDDMLGVEEDLAKLYNEEISFFKNIMKVDPYNVIPHNPFSMKDNGENK